MQMNEQTEQPQYTKEQIKQGVLYKIVHRSLKKHLEDFVSKNNQQYDEPSFNEFVTDASIAFIPFYQKDLHCQSEYRNFPYPPECLIALFALFPSETRYPLLKYHFDSKTTEQLKLARLYYGFLGMAISKRRLPKNKIAKRLIQDILYELDDNGKIRGRTELNPKDVEFARKTCS
jgi:hypothetical protein